MAKKATLYYNPHCGSCRKALLELQGNGYEPELVEYLRNPPSETDLDTLLKKLNADPAVVVREKEPLYQQEFAGKNLTRSQWISALHRNPILIQRPIVVIGDAALVARPVEILGDWLKRL